VGVVGVKQKMYRPNQWNKYAEMVAVLMVQLHQTIRPISIDRGL
jgi:hypothetical protein